MNLRTDTSAEFDRLSPFLRRAVYERHWMRLSPLQEEAIRAVLDRKEDVIISSGTATGKTEAALLPVLTLLGEKKTKGVCLLMLSPLKALINDQYRRLRLMTQNSGFYVQRYHSDAGSQKKSALRTEDDLLLLLTPESLEALLDLEPALVRERFSGLDFVLVDELHYFMESERGVQLLCVLERLQRIIGRIPRRIGLSATIGEPDQARRWLTTDTGRDCLFLSANRSERVFRVLLDGYRDEAEKISAIGRLIQGRKSLVFFPTRRELEETAGLSKWEIPVCLHHAGIASGIRQDTEKRIRESRRPLCVFATSTLELGIDIGNLERIVQIGAPYKVTSFLQRLGRSGRRSGPSEMAVLTELDPDPLHWELLLACAVLKLYTEKHWMETPPWQEKPFGVMVQQMLALVKNESLTPETLKNRVLSMGAFSGIEDGEYDLLYTHLINTDLLEVSEAGDLLPGMKGEILLESGDFYAVFASGGYRLFCRDRMIGYSQERLYEGGLLSLGGRTYRVVSVDRGAGEAQVVEVEGQAKAQGSVGSGIRVDKRILKTVQEVLTETVRYSWLSDRAWEALCRDRQYYGRIPPGLRSADLSEDSARLQSENGRFDPYVPEFLQKRRAQCAGGDSVELTMQLEEWKRRWRNAT